MLKNKKLSILGDSISTYSGISNNEKSNNTIIDNPCFYDKRYPLEMMYWIRLLNVFDMQLCVNNSWSGGNLSGINDKTSGVNRARELSSSNGELPDLIIIFMGLNDLGRSVDPNVFKADYEKTLEIIKTYYPDADVCCVNIPDREPYFKQRAVCFNEIIKNAVTNAGKRFFIADLFNSRLNNDFYYDNTVDGIHPDRDGMRIISEIIEKSIKNYYLNK